MWVKITFLLGLCLGLNAGPVEEMPAAKDRTLYVRSLPGYPGERSDLYEVYMEPYYFAIGTKAMVELKAYNEMGMPMEGPTGVLMLEQYPQGVRISGSITGLAEGHHGFHVHEKGDLTKGCMSAGPHYNPYMVDHGAPMDPLRHVGDLGNIEAGADGTAQVDVMDHYLTLTGVRGAIGRTLIVHEKPDDLGRGNSEDSMKTGSAGARLACGMIGFV